RKLAAQIQPRRIQEIAAVTALAEIELTHPEVVHSFVRRHVDRRAIPKDECRFFASSPIIIQEQIMRYLQQWAKVPWDQNYELIKRGSRDGWNDPDVAEPILEGIKNNCGSEEKATERFQVLAAATKHAVCKAHHIANAIT